MRGAEAQRRLRRLERVGWFKIRETASGHEIWRSPNGKLKTLSLGHPHVERNQAALVRQAERMANQEGTKPMEVRAPETMTSVAALASTAPKAGAAKPREWDFKVYRTPDTVKTHFVELAFGEAELEYLGGVGARVSVELDDEGFWVIRSGGSLQVSTEGVGRYKVKTSAMTDAVPHTGRTLIPVERHADGFRLFPDAVTPVGTRHKGGAFKGDLEARQTPTEVELLPTAPESVSSPGDALEAEQSVSLVKFGTTFAAGRPVQPPKRAASIEDLRTALGLVRDAVAELGVTLYGANGLSIQLDDIEARVRL
jgi:hypothetical protein